MHEGIEYFNDFLTTNKPQPGMDLIQFHSNIFRNIMVCRIWSCNHLLSEIEKMNSRHFPPNTRPLLGWLAGSGQLIRGLVFGVKWLEFISQSQIKGNYNFSICTVFKFEFFWHKLRVVVSKGFDACIRVSRKKTGFNISWKYIPVKRNSIYR